MQVGDLVRFKRHLQGLEKAIGVVLKAYRHSAVVQWTHHYDKDPIETDKSFIEVIDASG